MSAICLSTGYIKTLRNCPGLDDTVLGCLVVFAGVLLCLQVSSVRMQGLLLLVFSKLAHVPFIRDIQDTYTRTGIFGYWVRSGSVDVITYYGGL